MCVYVVYTAVVASDSRVIPWYWFYSSVVTSTSLRLNVVSPLPCMGRPNSFFSRNITLSLVGLWTPPVGAAATAESSAAGSYAAFVRPNVLHALLVTAALPMPFDDGL